ncbi:unknown protein [Seminavis robusta]|uniref:Uncharacterized protein n=1 Tax=Seminavis robusta TaxID=568900 RepID=A0A9N8HRK7_9STRA|nr:unknown protein [Seminavis robusta]|eukprot:Sro1332_g263580.1 n/a (528) ;mRNA; f:5069-6753
MAGSAGQEEPSRRSGRERNKSRVLHENEETENQLKKKSAQRKEKEKQVNKKSRPKSNTTNTNNNATKRSATTSGSQAAKKRRASSVPAKSTTRPSKSGRKSAPQSQPIRDVLDVSSEDSEEASSIGTQAPIAHVKRKSTVSPGSSSSSDDSDQTSAQPCAHKPIASKRKKDSKNKEEEKDDTIIQNCSVFSSDLLAVENSQLYIQYSLFKGTGKPAFKANNIVLVNQQQSGNSSRSTEFSFDFKYGDLVSMTPNQFQTTVLETIRQDIANNSAYELADTSQGGMVWYRSKGQSSDYLDLNRGYPHPLQDKVPIPINNSHNWKEAVKQAAFVKASEEDSDEPEPESMHLNLLCTVKKQPISKKQPSSKQNYRQSSASNHSDDENEDDVTGQELEEEIEEIDLKNHLPFGYDVSLKVHILPPTKKNIEGNGYAIDCSRVPQQYKQNQVLEIAPPYTESVLKELVQKGDHLDFDNISDDADAEDKPTNCLPGVRLRVGVLTHAVKTRCQSLAEVLMGDDSETVHYLQQGG